MARKATPPPPPRAGGTGAGWPGILADKRVRYGGMAAAGLLGLVVLLRRRAAAAGDDQGATAGGSSVGIGRPLEGASFPNTTGTNIAGWLGDWQAAQQRVFDDWARQIDEKIDGIQVPSVPAPGPSSPGRLPSGKRHIPTGPTQQRDPVARRSVLRG